MHRGLFAWLLLVIVNGAKLPFSLAHVTTLTTYPPLLHTAGILFLKRVSILGGEVPPSLPLGFST